MEIILTVGVGFTVIENVRTVPVHPFLVGVTVMVAVTAAAPALVAVNEAMFPLPLADNPIVALLFVQL